MAAESSQLAVTDNGLGTCITSVNDLPEWDVILNVPGQRLGGRDMPRQVLALTSGSTNYGRQGAFVLTTDTGQGTIRHDSLLHRLYKENFYVTNVYRVTEAVVAVVIAEWESQQVSDDTSSGLSDEDRRLHQWWDSIIEPAFVLGASDIHLRASLGRTEVLFRILGELEPRETSLTQDQGLALASSMYNTMVDEGSTASPFNRRAPQSAVVTRAYQKGRLRLRYEHIPVEPDGLNVALRLIPMGAKAEYKSPLELGYSEDQNALLARIFARSSGMILFLGTTGSGKSTSAANQLYKLVKDHPGKLLRTVEEPVEILIPGASQTQVARSKDDTGKESNDAFVAILRSLVRMDPDYLMVGEIRDGPTAGLAIQAVHSGHLCVSTLHSDGAPNAYDRLMAMGVPRADIASVGLIAGLIYQRLVPVLCDSCKVPASKLSDDPARKDVLVRLASYTERTHPGYQQYLDAIYFRHAKGCEACQYRGIIDRTACAEIFVPHATMLQAIRDGNSTELWRQWRESIDPNHPENMTGRTAFEHALWKMEQGWVSPEDVEREFKPLDEEAFS